MKSIVKFVLLPSLAAALVLSAANAHAHITPTVIMAKRADAISNSLPAATNYFLRTVQIGEHDYAKIEAVGNFRPDVSKLKFFYGRDAAGHFVGTVLFDVVNTIHGPIQVGITFNPGGAVTNVVVTKATVETKPWIKSLMTSGFMKDFVGMSGHSTSDPLDKISKSKVGAIPYFMAQVVTEAVTRAIIYYDVLFRPNMPK